MTGLERAKQYVGIFICAGDRWEFCVPIDATVGTDDTVYLQGVRMRRIDVSTWELTENAKTWIMRRPKSTAEVTS